MFAGWTHYIAFDLFVARYIVQDNIIHKPSNNNQQLGYFRIPHLIVAMFVPCTLMAGPIGLMLYVITKALWNTAWNNRIIDGKYNKSS